MPRFTFPPPITLPFDPLPREAKCTAPAPLPFLPECREAFLETWRKRLKGGHFGLGIWPMSGAEEVVGLWGPRNLFLGLGLLIQSREPQGVGQPGGLDRCD